MPLALLYKYCCTLLRTPSPTRTGLDEAPPAPLVGDPRPGCAFFHFKLTLDSFGSQVI